MIIFPGDIIMTMFYFGCFCEFDMYNFYENSIGVKDKEKATVNRND